MPAVAPRLQISKESGLPRGRDDTLLWPLVTWTWCAQHSPAGRPGWRTARAGTRAVVGRLLASTGHERRIGAVRGAVIATSQRFGENRVIGITGESEGQRWPYAERRPVRRPPAIRGSSTQRCRSPITTSAETLAHPESPSTWQTYSAIRPSSSSLAAREQALQGPPPARPAPSGQTAVSPPRAEPRTPRGPLRG